MLAFRMSPARSLLEAADAAGCDAGHSNASTASRDNRSRHLGGDSTYKIRTRRVTADLTVSETACYGCSTWSREADLEGEQPTLAFRSASWALRSAALSAPSSRLNLRCIAGSQPAPADAAGAPDGAVRGAAAVRVASPFPCTDTLQLALAFVSSCYVTRCTCGIHAARFGVRPCPVLT